MKKFTLFLLTCTFLSVFSNLRAQTGPIRIVVLGSSTAAGTGPTDINNAWVNRYRQYVKSKNFSSEVINLAYGGYTTYQLMPDGFSQPADRPAPDANRNITKAISLSPNVIIVNLPSNDVASGYTIEEQMSNYDTIINDALSNGIPIYITTTQPRNMSADLMQNQMWMRDSINNKMGTRAIDFWTDIANTDGTIRDIFDAGDGTHLNDTAHYVLETRVIATDILSHSISDNQKDTIYVDFGSALSTGNWNNLDNAVTSSVSNMINSLGQGTGISISIHDAFTGINTQGATSPDPSTGFVSTATSDNFFGSVLEHSGIIEPTGGFTLSGLNHNSLYSFTIFASRMGATDNRETKYKIIGAANDSALLNPSDNTDNVAVISNMQPANNGTIIIEVSPGPNNDNSKNYYYIGAIRIVAEKQEVTYDSDGTINIDFGSPLSTGTWNNLTGATGNQTITDLVNTEGNSTGIAIWVHDAFTGINTSGTTTPDASLDFDPNASSDSFFGSEGEHSGITEPTGGITLAGLDEGSVYTLTFFASRANVSDNRETRYTVKGSTESVVDLDASNNTSQVVTVENMHPDTSGIITVDVSPGPNNSNPTKYYYLGILRIDYNVEEISSLPQTSTEDALISLIYPNPSRDFVNIGYTIPGPGRVLVTIFNQTGQVEKILVDEYQKRGAADVTWSFDGKHNGIYLCQVKVITPGKTYYSVQRIVLAE